MVLNLIITGIPSILITGRANNNTSLVLNLIITGIPSILDITSYIQRLITCFKPYYNWNTFNTYQVACEA